VRFQVHDAPFLTGNDAAQQDPGGRGAVDKHALGLDVGCGRNDTGKLVELREIRAVVGDAAFQPEIVACAVRLKIRVRRTSSKPFMTDKTTINTATPRLKPRIAMTAINETNPRRGEARR